MVSDPRSAKLSGILQLSGAIVDLVYRVDEVPGAGCEALVKDLVIAPGGGFIAMAAARRLDVRVTYAGGLGSGPLAQIVGRALERSEITSLSHPENGIDQGCSTVLIDNQAERTLIAHEGAEGKIEKPLLPQLTPGTQDFWLVSGYRLSYAASQNIMAKWLGDLQAGPPLVFDPSPSWPQIPKHALDCVLQRSLWISANEPEARALTGEPNPAIAARALLSARTRTDGGVIVRAAEQGCYLAVAGHPVRHFPGHAVSAVDTNGAGDTHIGSFLGGLIRFGETERALEYANIAAALATTRHGPAAAPPMEEVLAIAAQR